MEGVKEFNLLICIEYLAGLFDEVDLLVNVLLGRFEELRRGFCEQYMFSPAAGHCRMEGEERRRRGWMSDGGEKERLSTRKKPKPFQREDGIGRWLQK